MQYFQLDYWLGSIQLSILHFSQWSLGSAIACSASLLALCNTFTLTTKLICATQNNIHRESIVVLKGTKLALLCSGFRCTYYVILNGTKLNTKKSSQDNKSWLLLMNAL